MRAEMVSKTRRVVFFCRNLGVLELPLPIIIVGNQPFAGQLLE